MTTFTPPVFTDTDDRSKIFRRTMTALAEAVLTDHARHRATVINTADHLAVRAALAEALALTLAEALAQWHTQMQGPMTAEQYRQAATDVWLTHSDAVPGTVDDAVRTARRNRGITATPAPPTPAPPAPATAVTPPDGLTHAPAWVLYYGVTDPNGEDDGNRPTPVVVVLGPREAAQREADQRNLTHLAEHGHVAAYDMVRVPDEPVEWVAEQ